MIAHLQVPAIIRRRWQERRRSDSGARSVKFLQGPAIDQALKDYGMEKGHIDK